MEDKKSENDGASAGRKVGRPRSTLSAEERAARRAAYMRDYYRQHKMGPNAPPQPNPKN